jgi:hypothetical protein
MHEAQQGMLADGEGRARSSTRLVKGGGRAVKVLAWFTARVEATNPAPRILMVRSAGADRDRADVDVTVIDVPAIFAFGIAAAGKLGHGP